MNKRILILLCCLVNLTLTITAQKIFLQTGDEIKGIYDAEKLADAISDAEENDVIYLTKGTFGKSDGNYIYISKKISFVGCGADETMIANGVIIQLPNGTILPYCLFDGISFNSFSFEISYENYNHDIDNVILRRCSFGNSLYFANGTHHIKNLTFDRCHFNYVLTLGTDIEKVTIKNSWLSALKGKLADPTLCLIENCYVEKINSDNEYSSYDIQNYGGFLRNSIVRTVCGYDGFGEEVILDHVLYPNVSGVTDKIKEGNNTNPYTTSNIAEIYNDEATLKENNYLGTDGTVVGYLGGKTPYSLKNYLSNVSSSSLHWDKDNNKVEFKINVNAE